MRTYGKQQIVSVRSNRWLWLMLVVFVLQDPSVRVHATNPSTVTFRPYILKAVTFLDRERRSGGYDIHRRFTTDLHYGSLCCLDATRPVSGHEPYPTMCVAAV